MGSAAPIVRGAVRRLEQRARLLLSARHARHFARMVGRQPYAHHLTREDNARIRDYSLAVLGSSSFQPWLRFYTAVHGRFREGWIPEDFYGLVALPVVNGPYRNLSNAKTLSRRILATDRLPDLAYFVNGIWSDVSGAVIPRDRLLGRLRDAGPFVIVKAENSNQGRDVFRLAVSELEVPRLEAIGRLVVQHYVSQDQRLETVSPGCVATLRLTTGLTAAGTMEVLGSCLRIGRKDREVIRSAEAMKAVVRMDGTLDRHAYEPDYTRHETHPDTDAPFAGFEVPGFAAAAELCIALHRRTPQFTIIGWDVGIPGDGPPQILEWNIDHPDIKFVEAVAGPHLGPLRLETLARKHR